MGYLRSDNDMYFHLRIDLSDGNRSENFSAPKSARCIHRAPFEITNPIKQYLRVLGVVCLRKAHGCLSYKINNLRSISQDCVGPKEMVSYKYSLSYHQVHDLYLPLAPSFFLVDALYQHQCFGLRKYFFALLEISEKWFSRKIEFRLKII